MTHSDDTTFRPRAVGSIREAGARMTDETRWCVKCGALESEPARPTCKNPIWHAAPADEPPARIEPKPDEDGPFA